MLIDTTRSLIAMWSRAARNEPIDVRFITPMVATFLATARLSRPSLDIRIDPRRRHHAEQSGLNHALERRYEHMSRAAQSGGSKASGDSRPTWSRLTTLFHHAEIESCNQAINDLLFAQMEKSLPATTISAVAQVVGELHDNVASHAHGRGFSAAQFYLGGGGSPDRLELAVADGGRGFLRNVRAVLPELTSHAEAVRWCLQKGNTSSRGAAPTRDIPSADDRDDPYAETGSHQRDHHMGWGLWLLHELARSTGGELWLWSGDCSFVLRSNGEEVVERTEYPWPGVLITLMFYPENADRIRRASSERLESLAKELGL
jgi:hypothetical protein